MNEAFKKQMLSSHEFYQAPRWAGKPWSYKIKYFYANYPELAIAGLLFVTLIPALATYSFMNFDKSRNGAIKKYRAIYTVVRDDHPKINEIIEEKEFGREFFPKY